MISGKALAKETHAKVRHLLYWMAEHIPTRNKNVAGSDLVEATETSSKATG